MNQCYKTLLKDGSHLKKDVSHLKIKPKITLSFLFMFFFFSALLIYTFLKFSVSLYC